MGDARAGERAARRVVVGAAGALVAVVAAVNIGFLATGGQPAFPLWYLGLAWSAAAITFGVGVAAPFLGDRMLRAGAGASVALYWLVLLLFPVAAAVGHVERMPWLLTASSAAVAASLVAGGAALGWTTLALGALAGVVYRLGYGGFDLDGVVNDAHAVLTAAVICVIGAHVLAVGAGLDTAAAARRTAAARESAERGRLAARTQAAALVHDEVLATLVLAASDLPVPQDRLAAQATRAATMVTRLVEDGAGEPLPLEAALAAEARRHGAAFAARIDASTAPPDAVREALVGASRQALGNAVRHAGAAELRLLLRIDHNEVEVEIGDTGRGFDLARVADDRLGIRQSIVGRMSRVAGGSAVVRSSPGAGTRIVLRYEPEPEPEMDAVGDASALRRGVVVIGVAFVVLQTLCAVLAALAVPGSWPLQAVVLAVVLVTAELLRRSRQLVPSRARSALVTVLVGGGVALVVATAPFAYGALWAVVALAFLLVALALRGRTAPALAGVLVIAFVAVAGGVVAGIPAGQILAIAARPVLIVLVAVGMLVVVERMQRRIAALHREAVSAAESESWSLAARAELRERTDDLARTVVPLLMRVAEVRPASATERREYAAWEGRLRDGLRAGALSREPLRSAVGAARVRGVDVVLLDDTGESIPEVALEPVLVWMAEAVSGARRDVVGRLHPLGRPTRASVTVDGTPWVFDGSVQDASSSFHGE